MQRDMLTKNSQSTKLTGSVKDKKFAEWRQSPAGKIYDTPMLRAKERFDYSHKSQFDWGRRTIRISSTAPANKLIKEIHRVRPNDTISICYNVNGLTGDVPTSFCAETTHNLRIQSHPHAQRGLHSKTISHLLLPTPNSLYDTVSYSFGNMMPLYRTFPEEWLKYQGNPAPFGNPKLCTTMRVYHSIKDSMIQSIVVRSNSHVFNIDLKSGYPEVD